MLSISLFFQPKHDESEKVEAEHIDDDEKVAVPLVDARDAPLPAMIARRESCVPDIKASPIRAKIQRGKVRTLKSMFEATSSSDINNVEEKTKRLVKSGPKPITPGSKKKKRKKLADRNATGLKQSLIKAFFRGETS